MSHVEDRWMRKARGADGKVLLDGKGKPVLERDPNRYGRGKRWRYRYYVDGSEKNESFEKKVDAENRKKEVDADLLRGTYIDPNAGSVTFRKQAEEVIKNRTVDASTRALMRERLAKHVYPVIGDREIGVLSRRPSSVQQLVKSMEASGLAASTIGVIMAYVGSVFAVALDDELIVKNPLKSKTVKLPDATKGKLVPWTPAQLFAMRDALPEHHRATVDVGKGVGLRRGEIFGFSPDDVEWLPGVVHVRRQLKLLRGGGGLVFAPPKRGKVRDVPLAESVKVVLAEQMRLFPPVEVTLPWVKPDGKPTAVRLFFVNEAGRPVHPATFLKVWQRALDQTGIVPKPEAGKRRSIDYRVHGMHMLRHLFASVLLTEGESPKAVADWMGHADGGALLLRTYAHLMPKSEERMRRIIDAAWREPGLAADGPVTAPGLIV